MRHVAGAMASAVIIMHATTMRCYKVDSSRSLHIIATIYYSCSVMPTTAIRCLQTDCSCTGCTVRAPAPVHAR